MAGSNKTYLKITEVFMITVKSFIVQAIGAHVIKLFSSSLMRNGWYYKHMIVKDTSRVISE